MIDFEKWEQLRAGHTAKPKVRINMFYYCNGDGNGDLLYNTCREIVDRGDQDHWAHYSLDEVFLCLERGLRWPDYMAHLIVPKDQTRMTQDPWIMAYCCAVHLDRIDLIEKYKPSVRIFNLPDKWAWRRELLGKPNLYWLWRRITPYNWMQHFVYVLYGYMENSYMRQIAVVILLSDISREGMENRKDEYDIVNTANGIVVFTGTGIQCRNKIKGSNSMMLVS